MTEQELEEKFDKGWRQICGGWYRFNAWAKRIDLDNGYTSEELRKIADLMDECSVSEMK